jgi:hypothetical protein
MLNPLKADDQELADMISERLMRQPIASLFQDNDLTPMMQIGGKVQSMNQLKKNNGSGNTEENSIYRQYRTGYNGFIRSQNAIPANAFTPPLLNQSHQRQLSQAKMQQGGQIPQDGIILSFNSVEEALQHPDVRQVLKMVQSTDKKTVQQALSALKKVGIAGMGTLYDVLQKQSMKKAMCGGHFKTKKTKIVKAADGLFIKKELHTVPMKMTTNSAGGKSIMIIQNPHILNVPNAYNSGFIGSSPKEDILIDYVTDTVLPKMEKGGMIQTLNKQKDYNDEDVPVVPGSLEDQGEKPLQEVMTAYELNPPSSASVAIGHNYGSNPLGLNRKYIR